jgi:hypothetical protein
MKARGGTAVLNEWFCGATGLESDTLAACQLSAVSGAAAKLRIAANLWGSTAIFKRDVQRLAQRAPCGQRQSGFSPDPKAEGPSIAVLRRVRRNFHAVAVSHITSTRRTTTPAQPFCPHRVFCFCAVMTLPGPTGYPPRSATERVPVFHLAAQTPAGFGAAAGMLKGGRGASPWRSA